MATKGRPKGISNFPNKAELKLDVAAWIASSKPLAPKRKVSGVAQSGPMISSAMSR